MKFKVGDKVKIISLDISKKYFGLNDSMRSLLGKTATIQNAAKSCFYPDTYKYEINNSGLFHEDDLILVNNGLEIE